MYTQLSGALIALSLCSLPLSAQEGQELQPGQEQPAVLDLNGRLERTLKKLASLPAYEYSVKREGGSSGPVQIMMGNGQGEAPKDPGLIAKRKGNARIWTKNEGQSVIAQHGERWAAFERDGSWTPMALPKHPEWSGDYLSRPDFLASRLLEILPKSEWKQADIVTLDGRPVRSYRVMLEPKVAGHLFETGAIPEAAAFGHFARMVVVRMGGAAGGRAAKPKNTTKVEVTLCEHPGSRIPVKFIIKCWAKNNGAQIRVMGGGMGFGNNQEEEEKEELGPDGKKRPKPTSTVTLELVNSRNIELSELDDEAQKLLGIEREGV